MTEKLYKRKIVLISLLKSKGINNVDLFTQIVKSSKRQLNIIHAKHIKHTRVNDKAFFKHIIKDRYFRKKTSIDDKKDILHIEIGKILKSRYLDNKENVLFQEFIQYLLELVSDRKIHFGNTHLFLDLVKWITDNYVVNREVNIINEIRIAGNLTLIKLKLVSEFIDHIDFYNYLLNDITKIQKLRSYHSTNIDSIIIKQYNLIEVFIKQDKLLKQIYNKLTLEVGRIQTKLLYNELVNLKEKLRQKMHSINYGIIENYDKIKELGDQFNTQVMPFTESGRVDLSDKEFSNLHINTIYFKKSDTRKIKAFKNGYYNNHKIDGEITIIFNGINRYNKKVYAKSYMIQYQYKTTIKQGQQFKAMMQSLETSIKNDRNYPKYDNFNGYITCSYSYPYLNQKNNYQSFKEYYKDLDYPIKFRNIYPYLSRTTRQKNKFLNFTSFNNNMWRDYLIRSSINRSLGNMIYQLDFNREITDFYNPKNQLNLTKRKQRLYLSNLITIISKDSNLMKLFKRFLNDLIKDYDNRIYLFEIYGIDALKSQIVKLQQYYNSNYNNYQLVRTKKALQTKRLIGSLSRQIKPRKIYLDYLIMQKFIVNKFLSNIRPANILIQSVLHRNIEKYLSKSLIRRITIQRSKVECIKICCNNLKSIKVNFLNDRPVYIKEKLDAYSKFDELLGTSEKTKIKYVEKDLQIDIIVLFKGISKFDRYFDLKDLNDKILNFKINDKSKLIDYLYKEKSILNQF